MRTRALLLALYVSLFAASGAVAQPETWTQVTDDVAWAPRVGEAIVAHDGALWVLGGSRDENSGCLSDVWRSEDGVSWKRVLESASWSPRNAHGAVSFKGRLWVTGGFDCERMNLGDVWSSADGVAWEKSATPSWEGRSGHEAVVFNDKLWVLGGGVGDNHPYGDVWHTEDGVTWMQAASPPWAARRDLATVVHDGKLWVIGGRTGYSTWVGDVWYTEDGETWQSAATPTWKPRYALASASFAGKLWVFGGQVGEKFKDGAESNEIWSTTDGETWELDREHAEWPPRTDHAAITFQDKLFLLGGGARASDGTEVWTSTDGVAWTNALGERWGARSWQATVEHNGYLWIIGGTAPKGQQSDVWRSRDGRAWEKVPHKASWNLLLGTAAVSFQGRIWVTGQRDPQSTEGCVWSSADGITWEEAAAPPWRGRRGHTASVYDNKIWLVGGMINFRDNNAIFNDVWYSPDGQQWFEAKSGDGEQEKGLAQIGSRSNHGAAVYDGKLWIAGGVDVQWRSVADVWWTTNGYEWTRATEEGPFLQLDGPELAAFNDHLWLIGGTSSSSGGEGGSGEKVWVTKDGESWAPYGDVAPWYPRHDPGIAILDNRLWLLGGQNRFYGKPSNDVWYTEGLGLPDIPRRAEPVVPEERMATVVAEGKPPTWIGTPGVDWTTLDIGEDLPGQVKSAPLVFDGQLLLHDGSGFWRTSDGSEWTKDNAATDFGPGPHWAPGGTLMVHKGALWDVRSNQLGAGNVWKRNADGKWSVVRDEIDWQADDGWAFSFRDKLWYVGGMRTVNWTNQLQPVSQIWSSSDGEDWNVVTEQTPWDGLEGHNHFLFGGKMWIVGGHDRNGRSGGIWTSENGTDWEELSARPDVFSPPEGQVQLFATEAILWALENTGGNVNTLWCSTDGVTWEKRTEHLELPQNIGYFGVEYNGLWLIPRTEARHYAIPDRILHTPDFKSWATFVFEGPNFNMYSNIFVVHEEKFWLFDAKPNERELPLSRVYSSSNGANWTLETDTPAWGERTAMGVVSHQGRLWMFGGHDWGRSDGNPGKLYNDVWVSDDGKEWERVLEEAPWEARQSPYVVSLNGKIVMLCGERASDKPLGYWIQDAWSTIDGVAWEQLSTEVPFRLSRDYSPPVVFNGKIWVVGAYGDNPSKIWNSEDGGTWHNVVADKSWIPRLGVRLIAHGDKLWAIGGITEQESRSDVLPHRPVNRVEWSRDGITWTTVSTANLDPERNYDGYLSMGGRMWRFSSFPDSIAFSGVAK